MIQRSVLCNQERGTAMKNKVNTSVTVNVVTGPFPSEVSVEVMGYIRRIAQLESMLSEQIAYKEALVAVHAQEMCRLREQGLVS